MLYLEGSTDLAILKTFAGTLDHSAAAYLDRPFVHYVGSNLPQPARSHFYGLREAKRDLVGVAIFDRLERDLQPDEPLKELMWQRREIENYLCYPEVLLAYAEGIDETDVPGPLFAFAERKQRRQIMESCIQDLVPPLALRNRADRWWQDVKASDDFLDRLFEAYFERLGLPNLLRKADYHILAHLVPEEMLTGEVKEKLDAIVSVAESAAPRREEE